MYSHKYSDTHLKAVLRCYKHVYVQLINHAGTVAASLLRGAARAASTPAGRAAVSRLQHHRTMQLHSQEERLGHTVRVH